MVKKWLCATILVLSGYCARGQTACSSSNICQGTITATSSDCSTANSCVDLQMPNNTGSASIDVRGTFSETLQFEVTTNGTNYSNVNCTPPNSTTPVTSTTSAGLWQCNVAGYTHIRVRASSFVSGSATATIQVSPATAKVNAPSSSPPSGSAGGDLSGTYPNPTVASLNGVAFGSWATSVKAIPTGVVVGTTDSQTLIGKTLTGASSSNSVTLLNHQFSTSTVGGTGSDQTIYTYTLPANTLGVGKGIRVTYKFNHPSGANSVLARVRFGGTNACSFTMGVADNIGLIVCEIWNNGATNVQETNATGYFNGTSLVSLGAHGTAAIDTTSSVAIVAQTAVTTDSTNGETFTVELIQ